MGSRSGLTARPDEGDRFVSDVRASKDPTFRDRGAADFDGFARNIYKVLLTRGMQGTVVCSTDPETQAKLRDLIG